MEATRLKLEELELLAEFEVGHLLELDAPVGLVGVAVGAGTVLRLEMGAVLAREAELVALGLGAEHGVDTRSHGTIS